MEDSGPCARLVVVVKTNIKRMGCEKWVTETRQYS
jgi:hypothetical protein